jgi:hypothetical protein
MTAHHRKKTSVKNSSATIGFEAKLQVLFAEPAALEEMIRGNWREMGYGR